MNYMAREDLEKVVRSRVKPIIDIAMQKLIGARVVEIEADISDRIANPMLDIEIDTSKGFKKSKELFKRGYLIRLLQTHLCNISKVADVAGIDRRSMHRIIKDMDIDILKIRKNLLSEQYVREEEVKGIIESTLVGYKGVINPDRLERMYKEVPALSKDILKELPKSPMTLKEAEEEFEKRFILKAVNENSGNISKTAKKIGLRYETLHRKMKSLGI